MLDGVSNTEIVAEALSHKLHREGEFVGVLVNATEEFPFVTFTDTYPEGGFYESLTMLSKYEFGQWLNRPDEELENDLRAMLARAMADNGPLSYIMVMDGGFIKEDIRLGEYFSDHAIHDVGQKLCAGLSFDEAFDLEELYADMLARGIENTPFRDMESSQVVDGLVELLAKVEEGLRPTLEIYREELPDILYYMVNEARYESATSTSLTPPDVGEVAEALATDIPAETEILLRVYPNLNALQGSIFLVSDIDDFKRRLPAQSSCSHGGGEFMVEHETLLVTNSTETWSNVPPWRFTAIHEVVHQVDHLMAMQEERYDYASEGFISQEAVERIAVEVNGVRDILEKMLIPEATPGEEQERFVRDFQHALFPSGMESLSVDDPEMFLEDLLFAANSHFSYVDGLDGEAYVEYLFPTEHTAFGGEIIHTLATEIQVVEPTVLREEAIDRACDAIACFSPTLVEAVHTYWQERDSYLDQLREQQGPLQEHLQKHNTSLGSLHAPNPSRANSTVGIEVAFAPAERAPLSSVGSLSV